MRVKGSEGSEGSMYFSAIRQASGYSQHTFARYLGVYQSRISEVENLRRKPKFEIGQFLKMAKIVGLTVEELEETFNVDTPEERVRALVEKTSVYCSKQC